MPISCRAATAARLVGLTTSAAARIPISAPSCAKNSGVFPWAARVSAIIPFCPGSTPSSRSRAALPARKRLPWISPRIPFPGMAWKFSTGHRGMLRRSASVTTAAARGCSDSRSSDAAAHSSSSAVVWPKGYTSVTWGAPWVMVPVLSSTTVFTEWMVSSA